MSPEEKSLLERTYKMAEENNAILRSIRRTARIGTVMKVLYWVVIIGLSVGAFYFLQPYLEFMKSTLGLGENKTQTASSQEDLVRQLQDLLK